MRNSKGCFCAQVAEDLEDSGRNNFVVQAAGR